MNPFTGTADARQLPDTLPLCACFATGGTIAMKLDPVRGRRFRCSPARICWRACQPSPGSRAWS
ncbi:hypothetical protein [Burkholderia gladioli]|uniref:hypothetical protein n=1 Tax=Burkholderia gladioli TaxID=28095 RepID=UPI001FC896A8|nr:hypothetical protein [Burkholderia gladioli]